MPENILFPILSTLVAGLLIWGTSRLLRCYMQASDKKKVYKWLLANTLDVPGESHVDTSTIAKGTHISEERVRTACMLESRIFRLDGDPELWSIWRKEIQSVYEKRGLMVI